MGKEALQKITFEQLVQRSIQREHDKMKVAEIEIPSMSGTLLLKKISENKLLDIIEEGQKGNSLSENIAAERKLEGVIKIMKKEILITKEMLLVWIVRNVEEKNIAKMGL